MIPASSTYFFLFCYLNCRELKGWKDKFEMDNLNQLDLVQFFHTISPYFLTIEPKDDPSELGK